MSYWQRRFHRRSNTNEQLEIPRVVLLENQNNNNENNDNDSNNNNENEYNDDIQDIDDDIYNNHRDDDDDIKIEDRDDNDNYPSSDDDDNNNDPQYIHQFEDINDPIEDIKMPDQQEIINLINNLPRNDIRRKSWESLISHNKTNKYATEMWYPFRNEICLMLFLGLQDQQLSMTRKLLQWFIWFLNTLQDRHIIGQEYWLPKSSQTVESWINLFPNVPFSYFICFIYIYIFLIVYESGRLLE
jgi:hypothetical protein